jgi:hypothetical protein
MKHLIKALVPVLLIGLPSAHAQTSVQLHGLSKHSGTRTYNEVNSGVSIRSQLSAEASVQAGVYKNSYNKTTVFVAAQWEPLALGPVRAGAFAGVGTGYPLPVLGGFMATLQAKDISVTLRGIPKVSKATDGVLSIELGVKIK